MNNNLFQKYLGESALLLMTIIWGGTFVIVKESLADVSPLLFVGVRFGIAALIVTFYFLLKGIKVEYESIKPGMFLGLLLFLGFFFQTTGLKITTATKSGFITGSLVVMIPLFQTIFEKRLPSKGAQIGTVLVFIGLLFLSSSGTSLKEFITDIGTNFNTGDWLTLICAMFFALHVVFIDIISPKNKFIDLLLLQLVTVSILSFIIAGFFELTSIEKLQFDITFDSLRGILYTSLLATLVNFSLQTRYQKVVSPTKAGIIYSFEPIFAALFAFFLLNEKITNFGLAGSALIFLGLIAAEVLDNILDRKT
ncbi:MAG: DMT family transporter [Bacteroidota bacterium]|jgi:drug/metabolite transporter (DMT)-like permease